MKFIRPSFLMHFHYIKKIFPFLGRGVTIYLALGILAGCVLFALEVAFSFGLQAFLMVLKITTQDIIKLPSYVPSSGLTSVMTFILGIGIARSLIQGFQIFLQAIVVEKFRLDQRKRITRWVFHSEAPGTNEVVSLFNDRVNNASAAILALENLLVFSSIAILTLIKLLLMSPFLTLAALSLMFVFLLPTKKVNEIHKNASYGLLHHWDKTSNRLMMSLKNLLLLHIYGTESIEEGKTNQSLADYYRDALSHQFASSIRYALPQITGVFLICFLAMISNHSHLSSPALLISYFYLFIRFSLSLASASHMLGNLKANWPQIGQLAKWWADHSLDGIRNFKPAMKESSSLVEIDHPVGWSLKDISYSYPNSSKKILQNFSLVINPGEIYVIMGPSGVGKSTILNLLLGLITPNDGLIHYWHHGSPQYPVNINRDALLGKIGYVGPESFLLEGTIRNNLIYGLQFEPSEEEIREALHLSECHFVFDLPNQLEHKITDQGQGLSAGQKQRLSLARALLRKPKALILDEATANLDADLEKKIIKIFELLKKQMTIVVVTHRDSFLEIADNTFFLSSHEEIPPVIRTSENLALSH